MNKLINKAYPIDSIDIIIVNVRKIDGADNKLNNKRSYSTMNKRFYSRMGKRFYSTTDKIDSRKSITSLLPINNIKENIGVIDIETFKEKDNLIPYAIGYKTSKKYESIKIYYITDFKGININEQSNNMMMKFCNDIKLFNNITYYIHNLGYFDAIFLLKMLIKRPMAGGCEINDG